jgi:hypothetical protein
VKEACKNQRRFIELLLQKAGISWICFEEARDLMWKSIDQNVGIEIMGF